MWLNILGHDRVVKQFRRALARGRLASTFLFVGPAGIGKRTFALQLAQSLLCKNAANEPLNPCGHCESCTMFRAGTHPDLHEVGLPEGKSDIPVSLLIGDKEHRMREGLCHDISLKPYMGGRKIAIINDAESLNREGTNCLLKTLEEPPPHSVLILISTSLDGVLPTIRSRSQVIRFEPLATEDVATILRDKQLLEDVSQADKLAAMSDGSVAMALELSDPELWKFRSQLLNSLTKLPINNVALAKLVTESVEAAGKEATLRRKRLKWLIGCVAIYFRELAKACCGGEVAADAEMQQAVRTAMKQANWPVDALIEIVEQCLETIEQIDRYVNQSLQIEAWLEQISKMLTPPVNVPTVAKR